MNKITHQDKQSIKTINSAEISRLGFGCSSFWAKSVFDEKKAIALVADSAYNKGINHFDTGPNYANGEAERRLGKALQSMDRDSLIISTKVGADVTQKIQQTDFKAANITQSLEQSLKRIGVDFVDILYLWGAEFEDLNDDIFEQLERFKREGKVRFTAVNSFSQPVLESCLTLPIDGVMLQYNVLDQSAQTLIDDFADAGKFVICATPAGQALYSKSTFLKPRLSSVWYAMRAVKKHRHFLKQSRKLQFLHEHNDHSAVQLALAYTLNHSNITSSVFGTTKVEHLLENIAAQEIRLEPSLVDKIRITYSG